MPKDYKPHPPELCDEVVDLSNRVDAMHDAVASGVAAGIRTVAMDEEFAKKFFSLLYEHGINRLSQWIGRRILTGVSVVSLIAVLTWLVKTGKL